MSDLLLKAIQLQESGDIDGATALFQRILQQEPSDGAALYSLGVICLRCGKPGEALAYAETGVRSVPTFAPMWFLRGAALQGVGQMDSALTSYDEALKLQPDFAEVLINSGVLLRDLFRHKEALERFNQALSSAPDNQTALVNCGIILTEFKESELAIGFFLRLLALNPDYEYGYGLLLYERLHIADWTDFEIVRDLILQGVHQGKRICKSLAFMALNDNAADQYLCSRIFSHYFAPRTVKPMWSGERYGHEKLRIAYVSPDFREHPVGHAMIGMLEMHDRSRFETIGISLGIDDGSRLRQRYEKVFDRFIDARRMLTQEIAETMREMEIDIAVDLAGYTADSRIAIFSYRPAPVQLNFLGYPGTLAVNYMDYIVADRTIIPEAHQPFYSEEVAYLPDVYFPYDANLKISERKPSRAEYGLPDQGIVFCSFSHDYKISPPLWAVWMELMRGVSDSVLWLVSRNPQSRTNFRAHAAEYGVSPDRLVFAERVPLIEDHLARYGLADIFLDTWPYNAHTTAADALFAGVPVVTMLGQAFPARVAASMLRALGLDELVTSDLAGYAELALRLAQNSDQLALTKDKVREARQKAAMFDTERFTRNWEALMSDLHNRKYAV